MIRIPTHQAPPHPGEILLEDFLQPMAISSQTLATAIGLSLQTVEAIINEKQNISASAALRLAKFFGTTHDFWLNLQRCWDIYYVQQQEAQALGKIKPYSLAVPANSTSC
jgi:addiction module HigA family antidote